MKKVLLLIFAILLQFSSAQDITGSWKAELEIQGMKLPLILNVTKAGTEYSATLDSPLQDATGIPVSKIAFSNGELTFESAAIGLSYSGKYSSEPKIEGQFSQNGFQSALTFHPLVKPVKTITNLPADIQQRLSKVDEFLSHIEKNNIEAGKISIFKNGKEAYQRTFGQKNLPGTITENQYFQIGSITKTFTAVMLHQLAEQKKINLDGKLSLYFPQVENSDKITLRQMLNHTSGLADYVESDKQEKWLANAVTESQIMAHLTSQKTLFEPGAKVQYSNSGYYLLTKILEKATGKIFAENLNQMILKPAGMKKTFAATSKPEKVHTGFSYANGWTAVKDFDFRNIVGVGDIAADPADLNLFINRLFSGKILNSETVQAMKPGEEERFGLGIMRIPFYSKSFYGHSGGTYATSSLMIYNEEDQLSIAYSLNADRMGSNNFSMAVLSLLYGLDYEFPTVNNDKLTAQQLEQFVGKYTSTQLPLGIRIFVENGALYAQADGQPSFPLELVENNTFKFEQADLKITFYLEENKMTLFQNGEFNFTRK